MILSKLPLDYQMDKVISTIAKYFQKSQVLYSSIVYKHMGKIHLIDKNQTTPYFSKDWQCYCLIRAISNTFVTSGSILRKQENLYKSQCQFGDNNIKAMYQNLRGNNKTQVYVMSKAMKRQQILASFNPNIYEVLPQKNEIIQQKQPLYDIINHLKANKKTPILVECGTNVMDHYFARAEQKIIQSQVDTAFLTFYEGQLNQQSIGAEFKLNLQKFTKMVWQSEPIDVFNKDNAKIGTVCFKIYQKDK